MNPGLVSMVFGAGWYLIWWYAHDRGISAQRWDQVSAPPLVAAVLRRSGGPLRLSSIAVEGWAVAIFLAGTIHFIARVQWAANLEQFVWAGDAAVVLAVWLLIARTMVRNKRTRS